VRSPGLPEQGSHGQRTIFSMAAPRSTSAASFATRDRHDLHLRHRAVKNTHAVRLQRGGVLHLRQLGSTRTARFVGMNGSLPATARCRAGRRPIRRSYFQAPSTHQHHRDRHQPPPSTDSLDGSTVILDSPRRHSSTVHIPSLSECPATNYLRARTDATSHRRLARKVPVLG